VELAGSSVDPLFRGHTPVCSSAKVSDRVSFRICKIQRRARGKFSQPCAIDISESINAFSNGSKIADLNGDSLDVSTWPGICSSALSCRDTD